jgi:hypothetical protein
MADETILTGTAPDRPRRPPMADPRDIVCIGRPRFEVATNVTLDTVAAPTALWEMVETYHLRPDEVIDIVKPGPFGFLLTLRIAEIDRAGQRVLTEVLREDDFSI